MLAITGTLILVVGYVATTAPAAQVEWTEVTVPQDRLNAESIIATPTGFSLLGGPGPSGGVIWSTTDGTRWMSRTLPRVSSRIVFHHRGLFVVDRRQVGRVGPDGDDPTAVIELPDSVRIGNGSQRSGLVAAHGGLLAQTVRGDLYWSPDGRTFDLAIEAGDWGADSDVTPRPQDVTDVAPARVRSVCRPRSRRAPDVPPIVVTSDRILALVPEDDPSVVWPVCEPVLWGSNDGATWVQLTNTSPFPDGAYVYDVAWRDGRFVAVGGIGFDNAIVWTSVDGAVWERIDALTTGTAVNVAQVESGPIGWIVTGQPRDGSATIGWFSADGVCWESLPDEVASTGVAVGEDHIMLAESDPARIWMGSPSHPISPFRRCL